MILDDLQEIKTECEQLSSDCTKCPMYLSVKKKCFFTQMAYLLKQKPLKWKIEMLEEVYDELK